jgi:hypothetical protein
MGHVGAGRSRILFISAPNDLVLTKKLLTRLSGRAATQLLVLLDRSHEVGVHVFQLGFSSTFVTFSEVTKPTLLIRVLLDQVVDLPLQLHAGLVHALRRQSRPLS